jgi:hypothetical protein
MKKIYSIIAGLLLTASVFAQAPQKMSYQAVIRDASNNLTTTQAVGMQISILQGGATGAAVYTETQTPTTNTNGLVSLEIGTGTVVSGDFTTIDWANDTYFIKTETDPTGGTSYSITGTSQLMSVPYALHAKTAESITGGTSGHYVGELFGGGIVFYVYNNGANGLIASLDDLDGGSGVAWSATQTVSVPSGALNMTNGSTNTAAIVAQDALAGYAATLCSSYSAGSFTDWYLPSNRELYLLASHDVLMDQILDNDGLPATNGFSQEYLAPTYGKYWSSTESGSNSAWAYNFGNGSSGASDKYGTSRVRAVRAF